MFQMFIFTKGLNFKAEYIESNLKLLNITFFFITFVLSLQILFVSVCLLIDLVKFVQRDTDIKQLSISSKIALLIIALIIVLISPSVLFGMLYDIWNVYAHITESIQTEMTIYDFWYFAFAINYSLPLSGNLAKLQELIIMNIALRSLQIVHVILSKLLEFILIGFLIARISRLLDREQINYHLYEEIKGLSKLKNQKLISKEQYEKLKDSLIDRTIGK